MDDLFDREGMAVDDDADGVLADGINTDEWADELVGEGRLRG